MDCLMEKCNNRNILSKGRVIGEIKYNDLEINKMEGLKDQGIRKIQT